MWHSMEAKLFPTAEILSRQLEASKTITVEKASKTKIKQKKAQDSGQNPHKGGITVQPVKSFKAWTSWNLWNRRKCQKHRKMKNAHVHEHLALWPLNQHVKSGTSISILPPGQQARCRKVGWAV